MAESESPRETMPLTRAAGVIEALKVDFKTIKVIVLAAAVVAVLLATPLFFILRNFVTFDALDRYFKLTDAVRPKILQNIAEELDSGYSKNFVIRADSVDNTMLFHASGHQKVTLSVSAQSIGPFPTVMLYLNNCMLLSRSEPFHLYESDVTKRLDDCSPDEPDLHTLRIAFPSALQKGSVFQMSALVLVYQRIHDHLQEDLKR